MCSDESSKVPDELEEKSGSIVAETCFGSVGEVVQIEDERLTHGSILPPTNSQANRVYFVYVDWTLETIPRAFYVGMGDKHRTGLRDRNELWKRVAAKHGWRREVVIATKSKEFAFEYEMELIVKFNTYHYDNPHGCNFTHGGDGSHGGYRHTAEYREKHSGHNHPRFGKSNPKLVELNVGWKGPTHPRYGKKHSQETCVKISRANGGTNHPMYGKKQSVECVRKRSGELNARALLTWAKVNEIRRRHADGTSCTELAELYGVLRQVVYKIVTFKTWKIER